MEEDPKLQ